MIIETKYTPINFGTTYRKVYKPNSTILLDHESSTSFYNAGLQWNKFFNHFIEKFKDVEKVNIFSLACSDGSEAFSTAMLLISKLGDKAKKYFPITAVDLDDEVMHLARSGYIDLSAKDELLINKYTGNKLNTFFEQTNLSHLSNKIGGTDNRILLTRFKIKNILRDKVKFITEDVHDYVDKMPDENNIIFCRNCWPYLQSNSKKNINDFVKKLSSKMDTKSYLITGNYDGLFCPLSYKNMHGFSMSETFDNVYDKSGSNFHDPHRWFFKNNFEDDI